ncbi:hypothetical protein [Vulgatibacter sp.]|uniref:hypothetical protein n=1 Tax=Vulgatibacter sp. TaxID=1971226 RepID=UPI0035652A23
MGTRGRPTFAKRQKEQARAERQKRKEERKEQRQAERADRGDLTPGADPDIAHIVPGPQPIYEEEEAV